MEKRICKDCGHSFGKLTYDAMKCSVSKSVRTFYSNGKQRRGAGIVTTSTRPASAASTSTVSA